MHTRFLEILCSWINFPAQYGAQFTKRIRVYVSRARKVYTYVRAKGKKLREAKNEKIARTPLIASIDSTIKIVGG